MNKNVLIKGILVLVVIALLTMGLTGCGAVFCTTATINITTPLDSWEYWIYMDGNYWTGTYMGTTNWNGNITLYNVPIGFHTFYALSSDWAYEGYASATITCGVNNVAIFTYP
jgi:hypothetical protein